ncbi:beta-1,3-galactosyltransferase 5 [Phlebotomus argentipes]|uniref:beta-1,3-galactosyltransferase 5 n=1 Tax=Phlebotomus argentipes TaxID=94469 RepID=UPI0028933248|nr:beta-1,3-galactosyltransferase 5 [Phlebotomus argentipes]XP_059614863.1 beta-1,3-galactosyltransferase 5 [Phlebotomus argentipes]
MVFYERRSILVLFIGLLLCITIWRASQPQLVPTTELTYRYGLPLQHASNSSGWPGGPQATLEHLSPEDRSKLIDLVDFEYVIGQKSCSELHLQPLVLILVHSAPGNWRKRNLIRRTWGRDDARARLLFLLGTVASADDQLDLVEENQEYGDLIQGNFIDAYRNMTYKHAMALKWFTYSCPEAHFLLKTDDDVFVNSPTMFDFLENGVDRRRLVACYEVSGARVKRSFRSKWRVSTKEYPGKYYPAYCPGFSIIYSPDAVVMLYREAQRSPYFWIDDVHVTGTLVQRTNMTITPLNPLFLTRGQMNSIVNGRLNATSSLFFFTIPDLKEREIVTLWKIVTST